MIKKLYIGLLASLSLSLAGCIEELDLENLRPEPRLVLNSVVVAGEPVTAGVSRTWFLTEDHPNVTLRNVEVLLQVNGQPVERMLWEDGDTMYNGLGQYISSYRPVSGERVEITAKWEKKEVSATTILPESCPIKDVVADYTFVPGYSEKKRLLSITFEDNPGVNNYYLIRFEINQHYRDSLTGEYTGEYFWRPLSMEYDLDPLFSGDINAMETVLDLGWMNGYHGRVFSNDLFRGKEYTLKVYSLYDYSPSYGGGGSVGGESSDLPFYYRAILYSITEDYYKYMKTLLELTDNTLEEELVNLGLAEPAYIFSNITGGTGILGGCAADTMDVKILD